MTSSTKPNAKVLFRIPNKDGSAEVETLWATSVGGDNFRLENSPFWAYGVSWEDVVFAPFSNEEGFPTFQSIVSKAGNRTVRVIFKGSESEEVLQGLVSLGCSYEGMNPKYVSVNIPSCVNLDVVRSYLVAKEAKWEYADPTYASLFPADA
jgi:hypothetical protein